MIRALSRRILWLLVLAGLACTVYAAGFLYFVNTLPQATTDPAETDAIVVLTGGGDRIATGLRLLQQGLAKRLFVSGVHPGVGVDELLKIDGGQAGAAAGTLQPDPALALRIDLGDTAGDTFGNAIETADWMHANHFRSLRLVTADYHMPRALIEFRMAAPDLTILPNPVRPARMEEEPWWRDRQTFDLLAGEYGKYLIARWRTLLARGSEAK
jgi:uncharacterized SAM-binding protein YcdF (DUF218 family)